MARPKIRAMRILEYSESIVKVMEEFYRICKNKAIIKINVPASPSPNSFQDPRFKVHFTYNTFTYFERKGGTDDKAFKPHFKILKREYIFSESKLKFLNFLPNIFPKFYTRFLFMIFPSDRLYFELEVKK